MARNASDGSSVRAALDLNQSGGPRMLFHEIAKIMECGAFEREKAPRPNECRETIDSCPRLERPIGGICVDRQHGVQPGGRILDMYRRRMERRWQSTTRNTTKIMRITFGNTAHTARVRERRGKMGTGRSFSEAHLHHANARWRTALRRH